MIRIRLKRSRQADILRFGAIYTCPIRIYGYTAFAGRRVVGMAGVAKTLDDGRFWAYVFRAPDYEDVLAKGLHRHVLRFIAGLRRNHVGKLYATIGDEIPRAAAWMQRLGFRETDEKAPDGKTVYRMTL